VIAVPAGRPKLRVIEGTRPEPPRPPSNRWMVLMGAGGAVVVASALFTSVHLSDRTIYTVLVPGVVVGLALVVASIIVRRR